jgi:hypothetical protein
VRESTVRCGDEELRVQGALLKSWLFKVSMGNGYTCAVTSTRARITSVERSQGDLAGHHNPVSSATSVGGAKCDANHN